MRYYTQAPSLFLLPVRYPILLMLRNYFTLALRNLYKRSGFSFLNIAGLTLGMVCCLLILQYVWYERGYDRFPERADDIYRIRLDSYRKGELSWRSATVFPAYQPFIQRDFPEVEAACRLHDAEYVLSNRQANVQFAEKKGYFADASFLQVFNLPLSQGSATDALDAPAKIVLSEQMARKYFGTTDVLGKSLSGNFNGNLSEMQVSGVFNAFPEQSHLTVDYLVSMPTLGKFVSDQGDTSRPLETSWGWYDFYTYVKLRPHADAQTFAAKIPAFTDKYINNDTRRQQAQVRFESILQPLRDIHLYSDLNQEAEVNGDGNAVSLLFWVALFILGIAWINYINLATARAMERAREVGVRKAAGAARAQLMAQFLFESFLLNAAALVLALGVTWMTLPAFSHFLDKNIQFGTFERAYWLGLVALFMTGAIGAGFYPALVLSGFKPALILKGAFKNSSQGTLLRKGLIVGQFAVSVAMLAGVLVVSQQINFMRSQSPGFDKAQTLVLEGPNTLSDSLYGGVYAGFKKEITQIPEVQGISGSSSVPGDEIYWTSSFMRLKSPDQQRTTLYILGVDLDFSKIYDLKFSAGRNFEITDKNSTILNETAARMLGFSSPETAIGQQIMRGGDTSTVRGVVRDFNHLGLQKNIDPMCLRYGPDQRSYYSLKISGGAYQQVLSKVEATWKRHYPADPYSYFFLDEFFDKQYKSDVQFGKVFSLFTLVAILVACLGLFGLATFTVQQRNKEIGIRKVLGASIPGVAGLLAKDFLGLVLLSIVVATPFAWYLLNDWLQDFAYHIQLNWWAFALAGLAAILIAMITVGFQSIKAALANPVKSLRSE